MGKGFEGCAVAARAATKTGRSQDCAQGRVCGCVHLPAGMQACVGLACACAALTSRARATGHARANQHAASLQLLNCTARGTPAAL